MTTNTGFDEESIYSGKPQQPDDQASWAADVLNATASHAARSTAAAALRPQHHPLFDGLNCLDCGDEIPERRLKMGRIYCVTCQTEIERHGR